MEGRRLLGRLLLVCAVAVALLILLLPWAEAVSIERSVPSRLWTIRNGVGFELQVAPGVTCQCLLVDKGFGCSCRGECGVTL